MRLVLSLLVVLPMAVSAGSPDGKNAPIYRVTVIQHSQGSDNT